MTEKELVKAPPGTKTVQCTAADLEGLWAMLNFYRPDPNAPMVRIAHHLMLIQCVEDCMEVKEEGLELTASGFPAKGALELRYPSKCHKLMLDIIKANAKMFSGSQLIVWRRIATMPDFDIYDQVMAELEKEE